MDFTGKKVIITGGSRGLGKGIADAFSEVGADVCVIDLNPSQDHKFVLGNLSKDEGRIAAFEGAYAALGGVDALINCAGIQRRHKSEEFPLEDWDAVININLTATFRMCQLAARKMLEAGHGKIVNIASMLSFFGGYTVPAYAASKGGVAQVTKAFANEWANRGINVNAIAPGYMDTEMNTAIINDPKRYEEITARIPAGRWGTGKDVAGVAMFLCSDYADYLHGAIIPVDGGYLSR